MHLLTEPQYRHSNALWLTPLRNFQYTGKELDVATGLDYYGCRYYDSQIGRFMNLDAHTPNYLNPQSLNRWTYVLNNPNAFIDSEGRVLGFWDPGGLAGTGTSGVGPLGVVIGLVMTIEIELGLTPGQPAGRTAVEPPTVKSPNQPGYDPWADYSNRYAAQSHGIMGQLQEKAKDLLKQYLEEHDPVRRANLVRIMLNTELEEEDFAMGENWGGPLHGGHLFMKWLLFGIPYHLEVGQGSAGESSSSEADSNMLGRTIEFGAGGYPGAWPLPAGEPVGTTIEVLGGHWYWNGNQWNWKGPEQEYVS
jgi:RHS repeat-associated protein